MNFVKTAVLNRVIDSLFLELAEISEINGCDVDPMERGGMQGCIGND